ncbi:MAG TPA: amidohydrolase [Trueperaceae bacterium]|nr:amidohydrolase [Trueperaceae bacterium]
MPKSTSAERHDWRRLAAEVAEEVVAWRRHLHSHPELSFQEHETAAFVEARLKEFGGFEIARPTATSVVARLHGRSPGPTVALRADMDALPIEEESGEPFASERPGVMHACGHDGHTAILLGVARILSRHPELVRGELRFLFQHAEELFPGGAQELVDQGVLDGADAVLGLHLQSPEESGMLLLRGGPMMAAPDSFDIKIVGKGGHAAMPETSVDPIAIGAQVVSSLQQLVSRTVAPLEPLVLSVTQFHAGTAYNIIPESATLAGTVRSFDPELRSRMPELMEQVIKGVTEAHGAGYAFDYHFGYRSLVNDEAVTETLRAAFVGTFGEERVATSTRHMGGEDFSAYLAAKPGTFFYLGARPPGVESAYPHHHPKFAIDEAALETGVAAFLTAVEAMGEGKD